MTAAKTPSAGVNDLLVDDPIPELIERFRVKVADSKNLADDVEQFLVDLEYLLSCYESPREVSERKEEEEDLRTSAIHDRLMIADIAERRVLSRPDKDIRRFLSELVGMLGEKTPVLNGAGISGRLLSMP